MESNALGEVGPQTGNKPTYSILMYSYTVILAAPCSVYRWLVLTKTRAGASTETLGMTFYLDVCWHITQIYIYLKFRLK